MSCDKLVYDLATEVDGSPNIFLKKDWLNILDTQNGNYSSNQSVTETSQLANSNKFLSYREAYLQVPLVLSLQDSTDLAGAVAFAPATAATSADLTIGLKNWYGSIVHSILLDYNGTTIIQQQNFINMWNSWKLMTTLSWADVKTMGCTIGFYPDSYDTWVFASAVSPAGESVCNNTLIPFDTTIANTGGSFATGNIGGLNKGYAERMKWLKFDPQAVVGGSAIAGGTSAFTDLISVANVNALYKSSVFSKVNGANGANFGSVQSTVMATIYLKHLHSFFQQVPLLKGAYLRLTLVLNNCTTGFTTTAVAAGTGGNINCTSVSNAVGGINPLMLTSRSVSRLNAVTAADFTVDGDVYAPSAGTALPARTYLANISVGNRCLDTTMNGAGSSLAVTTTQNILMYVPAYTFNPVFESAYLSSPIKQIKYTDVYQYQVRGIASGGQINQLITNGIAGIKSILVLPFYQAGVGGLPAGVSPYQSPFDPAGAGGSSPLSFLNNFNVVVSGANSIYNTQRYNFEEWNNQLYGVNAVNGGMTDGLTSGLVDFNSWNNGMGGYYVDISRMLPVEESVPKSIQLIGQNVSAQICDYIIFVEYGVSISIDSLTGSRV